MWLLGIRIIGVISGAGAWAGERADHRPPYVPIGLLTLTRARGTAFWRWFVVVLGGDTSRVSRRWHSIAALTPWSEL